MQFLDTVGRKLSAQLPMVDTEQPGVYVLNWINVSEGATDDIHALLSKLFLDKNRLKLSESEQLLKSDHVIRLSSLSRWPALSSGIMGCISVPRWPCCRPGHREVNMGGLPELPETKVLA